jgi:ribosome-binding protein aMBF1 (putative translation factor)
MLMSRKKLQRVERPLTAAERQRHAKIRDAVKKEFPPKEAERRPAAEGIGAAIRAAREAQGMTWYALAQRAGVPNQATVRDIELGMDVKLSNLQAIAEALGLELELVPAGR